MSIRVSGPDGISFLGNVSQSTLFLTVPECFSLAPDSPLLTVLCGSGNVLSASHPSMIAHSAGKPKNNLEQVAAEINTAGISFSENFLLQRCVLRKYSPVWRNVEKFLFLVKKILCLEKLEKPHLLRCMLTSTLNVDRETVTGNASR